MEDEFFLKKMKGVKPFVKEERKNTKKNIIKKIKTIKKNTEKNIITEKLSPNKQPTQSKFELSFGEINKDLKRGKVKIDRRIDLHGYTITEAYEKFKTEVKKNYEKNKRCILVITGKGLHLKKENNDFNPKLFHGKIKNSIISWIKEDDLKKYILTYQNASFEYGGDGAVFVYLRKKN